MERESYEQTIERMTQNGEKCRSGCSDCPLRDSRDYWFDKYDNRRYGSGNCFVRDGFYAVSTDALKRQFEAIAEWAGNNYFVDALIKSCPICGSKGELYGDFDKFYGLSYGIKCTNTSCPMSKQQIYERTKENAISEWNHNTGKDEINT